MEEIKIYIPERIAHKFKCIKDKDGKLYLAPDDPIEIRLKEYGKKLKMKTSYTEINGWKI